MLMCWAGHSSLCDRKWLHGFEHNFAEHLRKSSSWSRSCSCSMWTSDSEAWFSWHDTRYNQRLRYEDLLKTRRWRDPSRVSRPEGRPRTPQISHGLAQSNFRAFGKCTSSDTDSCVTLRSRELRSGRGQRCKQEMRCWRQGCRLAAAKLVNCSLPDCPPGLWTPWLDFNGWRRPQVMRSLASCHIKTVSTISAS